MAKKSMPKKAQEEMIGFAIIIVLVSVILLAFLGFSLSKSRPNAIESYEVNNFVQAFLQYTTDCSETDYSEYFSIQDLIFECDKKEKCSNGDDTCVVLEKTLDGLIDEAWQVGEDSPYKGYKLMINSEDNNKVITNIFNITKGNITMDYKGSSQQFSKRKKDFIISFNAYS